MGSKCPHCGVLSVTAQDIEALCDSALLVKLENRIQLRCEQCGWMGCTDLHIDPQTKSSLSGNLPPERKPYMTRPALAIDDYDT